MATINQEVPRRTRREEQGVRRVRVPERDSPCPKCTITGRNTIAFSYSENGKITFLCSFCGCSGDVK